jgi:hypothetical protein
LQVLARLIRPSDRQFYRALDEATELMSGAETAYDDVEAAILAATVNDPESIRWTVFETPGGEYLGHALARWLPPVVMVMTARLARGTPPGAFRDWRAATTDWARGLGATDVVWWTERNPEAFDRLTGCQWFSTTYRLELNDGKAG